MSLGGIGVPKGDEGPVSRKSVREDADAASRRDPRDDTMRGAAAPDNGREDGRGDVFDEDARLDLLRHLAAETVLPPAPTIPGFHTCWLSTTHPTDTVAKRKAMGYQIVHPDELPGWHFGSNNVSAAEEGCIKCNEMILAKLPNERYQFIMRYFHHEAPQQMASQITAQVDGLRDKMHGKARGVTEDPEDDGLLDLAKHRAPPRMFA